MPRIFSAFAVQRMWNRSKNDMTRLLRFSIFFALLLPAADVLAVDSYRYLHVTINTPWAIFLFLLPIVLSPFIVMVVMYWRFAGRKNEKEGQQDTQELGNVDDETRSAHSHLNPAASGDIDRSDDV